MRGSRQSWSPAKRQRSAVSAANTSILQDSVDPDAVGCPAAEVVLSPSGTFLDHNLTGDDVQSDRRRQLAIAIRQRIESRLAGRVRDLAVRIAGTTVVLEGHCATYYTKQLAQHAALGVLEHDEQLDNAIVVAVA